MKYFRGKTFEFVWPSPINWSDSIKNPKSDSVKVTGSIKKTHPHHSQPTTIHKIQIYTQKWVSISCFVFQICHCQRYRLNSLLHITQMQITNKKLECPIIIIIAEHVIKRQNYLNIFPNSIQFHFNGFDFRFINNEQTKFKNIHAVSCQLSFLTLIKKKTLLQLVGGINTVCAVHRVREPSNAQRQLHVYLQTFLK